MDNYFFKRHLKMRYTAGQLLVCKRQWGSESRIAGKRRQHEKLGKRKAEKWWGRGKKKKLQVLIGSWYEVNEIKQHSSNRGSEPLVNHNLICGGSWPDTCCHSAKYYWEPLEVTFRLNWAQYPILQQSKNAFGNVLTTSGLCPQLSFSMRNSGACKGHWTVVSSLEQSRGGLWCLPIMLKSATPSTRLCPMWRTTWIIAVQSLRITMIRKESTPFPLHFSSYHSFVQISTCLYEILTNHTCLCLHVLSRYQLWWIHSPVQLSAEILSVIHMNIIIYILMHDISLQ